MWVAVNVVSVGLFACKGLWLTVLLYALFAAAGAGRAGAPGAAARPSAMADGDALRIAMVGAESTGKTTLAAALAARLAQAPGLRVAWVAEVLREWCDARGPHAAAARAGRASPREQHARIDERPRRRTTWWLPTPRR